jgi:hypothetical protein
MWRVIAISMGVCVGIGLPSDALAQISSGDRLAVGNDGVPVYREQKEIGRLKKGEIVTAEKVRESDGFTWIRIARPAGEWGWIHAADVRRVLTEIVEGDHLRVVDENVPVFREQAEVGNLKKGEIVKAEKIRLNDQFEWVKIAKKANEWGWVHAADLARDGFANVTLDKLRKVVVLKEDPPIRMARGTTKLVEDTRRIRHSITIDERWKVEGGVKVEVKAGAVAPIGPVIVGAFGRFEADIRAEIEKSTRTHYGIETERKRSVTIDGGAPKTVKVVWEEYYRTGTTTMLVNGVVYHVPFDFREDFGLRTEEVDDSHPPPDKPQPNPQSPPPSARPDPPGDEAEKPAPGLSPWSAVLIAVAAFAAGIGLAVVWLHRGSLLASSKPPHPES